MSIGFLGLFLNYATLAFAAVVFLTAAAVLIACRKKLSGGAKAVLTVLLVAAAVYLAFVLWGVVASGGAHPSAAPVPLK